MSKTYVYFIKPVGHYGPIKIGYSSFPDARLSTLQTWSPVDLEMLVIIPGDHVLEKRIHHRFAQHQVKGEWFAAVPELVQAISDLKQGVPVEEAIDLAAPTGKLATKPKFSTELAKRVGSYRRRVGAKHRAVRRATRPTGTYVPMPRRIAEILDSKGGYRRPYVDFTHEEASLLDAYLENPWPFYRQEAAT